MRVWGGGRRGRLEGEVKSRPNQYEVGPHPELDTPNYQILENTLSDFWKWVWYEKI